MKLAALAVAGLMTFGAIPAQAHHRHDENPAPAIITGAILGGLIYYGTRDHYHHDDHHHHRRHRRRHHRTRIIDEYSYRGRQYRICRRGNDAFYC